MAEPNKGKQVSLRKIMDEIAEDEAIDDTERERAREIARELDYQEWCSQQKKSSH